MHNLLYKENPSWQKEVIVRLNLSLLIYQQLIIKIPQK